MSAKVSFLTQEVTAEQQQALLAVNPDAIRERAGATSLFVIRDGRAVEIPVVRGVKLGDLVAIAGAVQSGEKVVLKPPANLKPGALVKTAPK
jgi:hypothetical protein